MDGRERRLSVRGTAAIVGLSALALLPGLGGSTRLSYHEAIVAQASREMIARSAWLVPTIGGQPWLEKPPLVLWLVKLGGLTAGDVSEFVARLPSVLAAVAAALAVGVLGARRFGSGVGLLAGCVQATVAWSVVRGRLAESDMLLAAIVAWVMVGLDAIRERPDRRDVARLVLIGLGTTALAKGIGFGAALAAAAAAIVLVWDRDRATIRAGLDPIGVALGLLAALAWPLAIVAKYPEALPFWTTHVADRLADRPEIFAGRAAWWAYAPNVLMLTLPWTPLALLGAWGSLGRAWRERGGGDRLLWAWAVGPLVLLSCATIKNAHYAIHALPPWSVWAALGLAQAGRWLEARGRPIERMKRRMAVLYILLAAGIGVASWRLVPRVERRGVEWSFYETIATRIDRAEPLIVLYDDWDRLPYPTPFGPVPHDWPVRLYYLGPTRATWRECLDRDHARDAWPDLPRVPFAAIARDRDLPGLSRIGRVERVAQGPNARWDRVFSLFRVTPAETVVQGDETTRR